MEGLYLAQKFAFDLAIVDLGLPRVPGLEIVKKSVRKGVNIRADTHCSV